MCKSGGECVFGPQRGCECESGCCVGDFLIEVSVQRVCKGCVRGCVSVQRPARLGEVCKIAGECLKVCNSVSLDAVRGILHRGECARGVRGCARVGKSGCECVCGPESVQ